MFWFGLLIAFAAGLLSIGLSRDKVKLRFPIIRDYHLDIVVLILFVLGLFTSGFEHYQSDHTLWEIKENTKSRHITADQRRAMLSVLHMTPTSLKGIYICAISFNPEAELYRNDFKNVLEEAGYKVKVVPALSGGVGVRILKKPDTVPEAISHLADALSQAGIKFNMGTLEEARTINPEKLGVFPCLYVGPK